jgi:hypothetical protein
MFSGQPGILWRRFDLSYLILGGEMDSQHYDLIGDIHGHADALRRLLGELGYVEENGTFRHEDRKVIFLGDFIDKGPEQAEVLRIVRRMHDAGEALAVMGNHEFNALAWATSDGYGDFLRPHTKKNYNQHAEFLNQLVENSPAYRDAISWFKTLPVALDFPGFRVVHACWHELSVRLLQPHLDKAGRFTPEGLRQALSDGTDACDAAEMLMKGPEMPLPDGVTFVEQYGTTRSIVRVRWWDPAAKTLKHAAIGMDDKIDKMPMTPLPDEVVYRDSKPVFFGHYWMTGEPTILHRSATCLDFSVAAGGYLTAYRWSGEREMSEGNLVSVRAMTPEPAGLVA